MFGDPAAVLRCCTTLRVARIDSRVLGMVTAILALVIITVGILSLARKRILARDRAGWKTPGEFGWFSVTMGLSLLLTSLAIITGGLGLRGLGWGLAVAAVVLAAAA